MKVLVVGGAGYIGSHTVHMLIERGHYVTVYDDLSKGYRDAVHKKAQFIKGDMASKDLLKAMKGKDMVIHFAGFIEVGESEKDPLKYIDNNVLKAYNVIKCMNKARVKNIIFSSSAAVYGMPKRVPIREDDEKKPVNCYGWTKLVFEQMLERSGLNHISLRYFNAAGAAWGLRERHTPESHLIPLVLQAASGKRPNISIFGDDYKTPDGTCIRDYIHVVDLAEAHVLAMEHLKKGGASGAYNVGIGKGYSVKKVIEAAKAVTGKDFLVISGKRRQGDPAILVADSKKLKKELGWKPKVTSIKEIIRSAWEAQNA